MDKLDEFIAQIIDAKQLPGLTEEVRTDLIADLRKQLLNMIDRALVESLSDEDIDAFTEYMEQADLPDDAAERFLADHGVDVEKVTARVMLQFRDAYLQTYEERNEA
jgi:hypothetical protein